MKNTLLLSLVCGISASLSGCGHHVIYQQVVKTDNSLSNTLSNTLPQPSGLVPNQHGSVAHGGLMPAPVVINQQSQSHHVRGVVLQQQSQQPQVVRAMITPQQHKTLMLVPAQMVNRRGVVVQSSVTSMAQGSASTPMVRIPVLALPPQAVAPAVMSSGYPQYAPQQLMPQSLPQSLPQPMPPQGYHQAHQQMYQQLQESAIQQFNQQQAQSFIQRVDSGALDHLKATPASADTPTSEKNDSF